ncbi:hypothetical protein CFELI_01435 [Corynebacterium felinum]|nr:hypothetical protein CFELI_01435 [Corynebacterium felinum]
MQVVLALRNVPAIRMMGLGQMVRTSRVAMSMAAAMVIRAFGVCLSKTGASTGATKIWATAAAISVPVMVKALCPSSAKWMAIATAVMELQSELKK